MQRVIHQTVDKLILFKAPGKVLLSGAYAVLAQGNIGLVLAVRNYFYAALSENPFQASQDSFTVILRSPQIDGNWKYLFHSPTGTLRRVDGSPNAFTQAALWHALLHFLVHRKYGVRSNSLTITLLFDSGFVSGCPSEEKFSRYKVGGTKTGLGSSACVIVSIVGVICRHFHEESRDVVNCLSQVANLTAQGKIGSNFDISCATFGTQLYRNVLPRLAYSCVTSGDISSLIGLDCHIKQPDWGSVLQAQCCSWLIDNKKGEDTRHMVRGFTKALGSLSIELQEEFYLESKATTAALYEILIQPNPTLSNLRQINKRQRELQQKFGDLTNTQIQPKCFTILLDAISELEGVFYAVCPGSGGYDALFVMGYKAQKQSVEAGIKKIMAGIESELRQICLQWEANMNVDEEDEKAIRDALLRI